MIVKLGKVKITLDDDTMILLLALALGVLAMIISCFFVE